MKTAADAQLPGAAVSRLDSKAIAALLGEGEAAHLQRKATGGANGFKGFKFEHLFGAHRIARLARKYFFDGTDALVEWQSDGFVDDFVVRRDAGGSYKGYQAKNAQVVSWTAGDRTIEQDFKSQAAVSSAEGYEDVRLRLVCSSQEVVAGLRQRTPPSIAGYSKAIYFPYSAERLEIALHSHPWMREDFAYLSRLEEPQTIEVGQVAGVLMGAWDLLAPAAHVSAVLTQARAMSPTLVRAFQPDEQAVSCLDPSFVSLMGTWQGFSYLITRGFLSWSAFGGSTSGVLSIDCFDPRFRGFQDHILRVSPSSFEEVEGAFI